MPLERPADSTPSQPQPGLRFVPESPSGGPVWQLRTALTRVLPKK
jgi:hypothetical protein